MEGRISTTSIRQGEQVQGEVMKSLCGNSLVYLVFFLEEVGNDCVKGKLIFMCEEVLFMEANVYKQKNMEGSCV